jgi:hypothetical protein
MSGLLVQVAIYGLAAAFAAPLAVVVSALILGKSQRPLASAWTFVAGAAFLDVVFAAVVLASGVFDDGGDAGAYVDVGLGVLFGVMGLVALFGSESPEKDAARQARAESIATAPLGRLFLAGIAVQIINFDAIAVFGGALKEIAAADVTTAQAAIALLFGFALMLSVYYVPALIYMLMPERAGAILGRMTGWIMANSRMLEIIVGLGFGAMFVYKGLAVLL